MKRLLLLLSVLLLLPGCASTSGKKEVSPEQVTYKESEKYDLTDEFYEKQNWGRNHSIIRCCPNTIIGDSVLLQERETDGKGNYIYGDITMVPLSSYKDGTFAEGE